MVRFTQHLHIHNLVIQLVKRNGGITGIVCNWILLVNEWKCVQQCFACMHDVCALYTQATSMYTATTGYYYEMRTHFFCTEWCRFVFFFFCFCYCCCFLFLSHRRRSLSLIHFWGTHNSISQLQCNCSSLLALANGSFQRPCDLWMCKRNWLD